MMLNFCTLFDSNYSAKGLAMYFSLARHCPSFHLYIFAFDDILADLLVKMKLPNVTIVPLEEFEDPELLAVKPTRTKGEYCWTCSSSTILYCLEHYDIDSCTYIDSDLFFFSDPQVLIDEMGENDVLITSHRYSKQYDQTELSGKYCVQFMTFKNNANGLKVLRWWRNECLKWCYAKFEDGKFGDQKYLDDWTTRFNGIHELEHLGGGVAPWNMQQYKFMKRGGVIIGEDILSKKEFPLVFFHFHSLQCYRKGFIREFLVVDLGYELTPTVRKYIYSIYLHNLKSCYFKIKSFNKVVNSLAMRPLNEKWEIIIKRAIKSKVTSFYPYNYYHCWIEI